MKEFAIVAKHQENASSMSRTAARLGLSESKEPEFIISIGGDGTFLIAERLHPGIPKLLIKDSNVCKKCEEKFYDRMFEKILEGKFDIEKHFKIQAEQNAKTYYAANDFAVRNKTPMHAIRFEIDIDGEKSMPYIGDGIVVSTPFGSTGYFNSITKMNFEDGIGLAFNNVTQNIQHRILDMAAVIRLKLLRHDADLTVDNDPDVRLLKQGESVEFKRSDKEFRLIHVR